MPTFTLPLKSVIRLVPDGNIGLLSYPIFNEDHRPALNEKIIQRYWNREIGVETTDMFIWNLRRRMNEIMPLYNKLYFSETIAFDPLSTINLKTVSENLTNQTTVSDSTAVSDSDTLSKSRAVMSDTPQTQLSGDEDYATQGNDATSTGVSKANATDLTNATADATQNGETLMSGYQGVASDLLMRYRESLLNIDLMIVNELNDLFMLVMGNGDEFSNYPTFGDPLPTFATRPTIPATFNPGNPNNWEPSTEYPGFYS